MNIYALAGALLVAGFAPKVKLSANPEIDHTIDLTDDVHVQVGDDGLACVVEQSPDGFQFYPMHSTAKGILSDLATLNLKEPAMKNLDGITPGDITTASRMDDLDNACRSLQRVAGITNSTVAGLFFFGTKSASWPTDTEEVRKENLAEWLATERWYEGHAASEPVPLLTGDQIDEAMRLAGLLCTARARKAIVALGASHNSEETRESTTSKVQAATEALQQYLTSLTKE